MRSRLALTCLMLESLECREVPAGAITAALTGGKLTITGDDQGNGLTVLVGSNSVTLTPDATTAVNGKAVGAVVVIQGTAAALSAKLFGGNDTLAIDGNSDFELAGGATFDLGDGTNGLNLTTTGKVTLGGLTVTAGDGFNTVVLAPGPGLGTVSGPATFHYGSGGGNATDLNETRFLGPAGLKIDVGKGGGNVVQATNITVSRGVSINTGGVLGGSVQFAGSNLGGLAITGGATSIDLATTIVNGNVSAAAGFVSVVQLTDSTVTGNVSAKGLFVAYLHTLGTCTVGSVSVSSGVDGQFQAGGTKVTVNRGLMVSGGLSDGITIGTAGVSEVKGPVALKKCQFQGQFDVSGHFAADGDVSINLGDGTNQLKLGDPSNTAVVRGRLTVKTGGGVDHVTLNNVQVVGATRIATGGGADALTIDGSTFQGMFVADLGAGDDTIAVGQATGAAAPVTFAGKATIQAGSGNDTLTLGKDPGSGGDAKSKAVFGATGNTIDGGTGLNSFDGLTPTPAPAQYVGLTVASFLNWTDPNP